MAGVAALAVLLSAQSAAALVYWGEGRGVGVANNDGSLPVAQYPYGAANAGIAEEVCGVAVDSTHIYWANPQRGAIGRMEMSPTPNGRIAFPVTATVALDPMLVTGLRGVCGVAVDAKHVYWAAAEGIGRANLDGTRVEPGFIPVGPHPCGVAVDAGHVYWGNSQVEAIGRAAIDGSEVENEFVKGPEHSCGVAVDAAHVYWSSASIGIGRANLDGTDPEPEFIPLSTWACGVAVDDSHIYWTNRIYIGQQVGTAALDGSGAQILISNNYGGGCGTAVDARTFVAPPPLESEPPQIVGVRHFPRRGTVVVDIVAPTHGAIAVTSPRIGWKVNKGFDPPWPYEGPLRWSIKLWAGKKGKASRRIKRQLARRGRAPLELTLSYQQIARPPVSVSRRLTLRKKRLVRTRQSVGHHR